MNAAETAPRETLLLIHDERVPHSKLREDRLPRKGEIAFSGEVIHNDWQLEAIW